MKDALLTNLAVGRDMLKGLPNFLRLHQLTLIEVRPENENIKTFIFTAKKPLPYQPGQYSAWFLKSPVKDKPNRLFTIASAPEDKEYWIATRISSSAYKQKLVRLRPGDTMLVSGGVGQFVLPGKTPDRIVFVAGGIGITPFRALARRIASRRLPVMTTLIHSGDNSYLFKDEMSSLVDKAVFTTRDTFADALSSAVKDNGTTAVYYVSGPPPFVRVASDLLKQRGVKRIRQDAFLGYRK